MQRDFLLSLAIEGLYRPVWNSAILEELAYEETRKLVRRGVAQPAAASRACRLIEQMRRAFVDAESQGWEGLEGTYGLPDPNDEHVVAAAVVAGAGAIVTHNMKDFPSSKIPAGMDIVSPAEFAANAVSVDPLRAMDGINAIAGRSGRKGPALTVDDVLDKLLRTYEMTLAVELIRQADRGNG